MKDYNPIKEDYNAIGKYQRQYPSSEELERDFAELEQLIPEKEIPGKELEKRADEGLPPIIF